MKNFCFWAAGGRSKSGTRGGASPVHEALQLAASVLTHRCVTRSHVTSAWESSDPAGLRAQSLCQPQQTGSTAAARICDLRVGVGW